MHKQKNSLGLLQSPRNVQWLWGGGWEAGGNSLVEEDIRTSCATMKVWSLSYGHWLETHAR